MLKTVRACEEGAWHLLLCSKADPRRHQRTEYRCRSWRHAGACRTWRGAQDFVRVRAATQCRRDWTYLVLTYAQKEWDSPGALYRAGVLHWARLRKRLSRRYGPVKYIQTWEQHKSGWPHVNVLIGNHSLYEASLKDWRAERRTTLIPMAVACGFGQRLWVEPMKDADSMAGYLTKLAEELTGSGQKSQVPIEAPYHFRRLRASQGVLPKPVKDPDITGRLCFCSLARFLHPRD
jgi:hypothetical protein